MNRNRQTKLTNKERKKNEAKKQQLVEQKQYQLRNNRYKMQRSSSKELINPTYESRRSDYFSSFTPPIDIGLLGLLGAASQVFPVVRIQENEQFRLTDETNIINHDPHEFKE